MITYKDFQAMHNNISVPGRARKQQSDVIMDATFTQDVQYQVGYFYDYYHDDEPLIYKDLHPESSTTKTPIELKFIVKQKNTENKDQVGYHIQFKTTQENPVEYYDSMFVNKWDAEFPVGLYLDLADSKGVYRKWLVTERADWLGLQFPTWYILPVDYVYQWVYRDVKGKAIKYQMCGVQRSQSSYNQGTWLDQLWFNKNLSNCWDTLRAETLKRKDEICLYGYGLKSFRIGRSAAKFRIGKRSQTMLYAVETSVSKWEMLL